MRQVLHETQSTSDVWTTAGGPGWVLVEQHGGGTWTLQVRAPVGGSWIDLDIEFDNDGLQDYSVPAGSSLRLTGGTAGASATAWGTL